MSISISNLCRASLIAGGFALAATSGFASGKSTAGAKPAAKETSPASKGPSGKPGLGTSGKMQVAEPKAAEGIPLESDSKAWQRSHAKGLTQEQKRAFRERKEKMQEMIAVIKEKRMAMRDAEPEKRAALARELHVLILEEGGQAQDAAASARTGAEPRDTEGGGEKGRADGSRRKQAEFRQLQMEKRKEELRKEEIRKQHLERLRRLQESQEGSRKEGRKTD